MVQSFAGPGSTMEIQTGLEVQVVKQEIVTDGQVYRVFKFSFNSYTIKDVIDGIKISWLCARLL